MDIAARNAVVVANLGLVHRLARQYHGCGLPHEDLVQYGAFGLIRAVEGFDPARGWKLSAYAGPWIRRSILLGLGEAVPFVRLPVPARQQVLKFRRAEAAMAPTLDRPPRFAEVADALGVSKGRRQTLCAAVTARRLLWHSVAPDRIDRFPARTLAVGEAC